ncbi:MAG: hypothetical protein BJ554DRAFT_3780, partial [Olpidium bornovanus]
PETTARSLPPTPLDPRASPACPTADPPTAGLLDTRGPVGSRRARPPAGFPALKSGGQGPVVRDRPPVSVRGVGRLIARGAAPTGRDWCPVSATAARDFLGKQSFGSFALSVQRIQSSSAGRSDFYVPAAAMTASETVVGFDVPTPSFAFPSYFDAAASADHHSGQQGADVHRLGLADGGYLPPRASQAVGLIAPGSSCGLADGLLQQLKNVPHFANPPGGQVYAPIAPSDPYAAGFVDLDHSEFQSYGPLQGSASAADGGDARGTWEVPVQTITPYPNVSGFRIPHPLPWEAAADGCFGGDAVSAAADALHQTLVGGEGLNAIASEPNSPKGLLGGNSPLNACLVYVQRGRFVADGRDVIPGKPAAKSFEADFPPRPTDFGAVDDIGPLDKDPSYQGLLWTGVGSEDGELFEFPSHLLHRSRSPASAASSGSALVSAQGLADAESVSERPRASLQTTTVADFELTPSFRFLRFGLFRNGSRKSFRLFDRSAGRRRLEAAYPRQRDPAASGMLPNKNQIIPPANSGTQKPSNPATFPDGSTSEGYSAAPEPGAAAAAAAAGPPLIPSTTRWTAAEDAQLAEAVKLYGTDDWLAVSAAVAGRTPLECSARWTASACPFRVKRGRWSKQEDALLREAVAAWVKSVLRGGPGAAPSPSSSSSSSRNAAADPGGSALLDLDDQDFLLNLVDACGGAKAVPWREVALSVERRSPNQCQTRWIESVDPRVVKTPWSRDEDGVLVD